MTYRTSYPGFYHAAKSLQQKTGHTCGTASLRHMGISSPVPEPELSCFHFALSVTFSKEIICDELVNSKNHVT